MNLSQIEAHFRKIKNPQCWNVEKGIGSFLTFEFGEPQIEFTEPKVWKELEYPLNQTEIRRVFIKGSEKLWIYCVDWKILSKGIEIAHNESDDNKIKIGAKFLNGQILEQVEISTITGETKFIFDLGGELIIKNKTHEANDESWMLFVGELVLTMNNKGHFNLSKSSEVTKECDFEKLKEDYVEITLHNKA